MTSRQKTIDQIEPTSPTSVHVLFVKGQPVAVSSKPFELPQYGDPSAISQQAYSTTPKESCV